ncbi:MAG: AtpZ/AtpI family protein [Bacteroidia bacterium]|nr:AtpZ/AtpI family protein [Bacteroidia bacterium]
MQKSEKNPIQKSKKQLNDYARYSGIAFQMIAVVLLGVFVGIQLDKWVHFKFPVFTVVLSISSVFIALYLVLKDLIRKK